MRKAWKIIVTIIVVLILACFIVPGLWIGGVLTPSPGVKGITEIYQNNRDTLHNITQYLSNSEYDHIYITDTMEDGVMFTGLESGNIAISDFGVTEDIKDIMGNHKCNVINKYDNVIVFQVWAAKDKSAGVVYSVDGNTPEVEFLTKIQRLKDDDWYYYEEDFNKWKLQNKQK